MKHLTYLAWLRVKAVVAESELGQEPVTRDAIGARRIVQAGRWGTQGGVAVVEVRTLDEAKEVVSEDPLIVAGLVDIEAAPFSPDVARPAY